MIAKLYSIPNRPPSGGARDELSELLRRIEPDLHTLAEEARRRRVIRTCRIIARREREAAKVRTEQSTD